MKNYKLYFQKIHYGALKPNLFTGAMLSVCEFFYKNIVVFKNLLYEKNILKENSVDCFVTCVGNLTTGGVGKTPIVIYLANKKEREGKRVAIISRGYGSKLSKLAAKNSKNAPSIIKDYEKIYYTDGSICGDEAFQCAKNINKNVIMITCPDRFKAAKLATEKYKVDEIILDDGFQNRKLKKDCSILVLDSKMRFGNNHLLPLGPLREPIQEGFKRADEIILTDKNDENLSDAINWIKKINKKNLKIKISKMLPKRIYNAQTKANIVNFRESKNENENESKKQKAIAFSAIGQNEQFFNFAKEFYDIVKCPFCDHYKYTKKDILGLVKLAKENKTNVFLTTQKDETKIAPLIKDLCGYCFNVLELEVEFCE